MNLVSMVLGLYIASKLTAQWFWIASVCTSYTRLTVTLVEVLCRILSHMPHLSARVSAGMDEPGGTIGATLGLPGSTM